MFNAMQKTNPDSCIFGTVSFIVSWTSLFASKVVTNLSDDLPIVNK